MIAYNPQAGDLVSVDYGDDEGRRGIVVAAVGTDVDVLLSGPNDPAQPVRVRRSYVRLISREQVRPGITFSNGVTIRPEGS